MNCAQALRHLPYCGRNLLPALPPACTHRHRQLQQAPTSPRSKRLKDKNTHVRKRKQKREKNQAPSGFQVWRAEKHWARREQAERGLLAGSKSGGALLILSAPTTASLWSHIPALSQQTGHLHKPLWVLPAGNSSPIPVGWEGLEQLTHPCSVKGTKSSMEEGKGEPTLEWMGGPCCQTAPLFIFLLTSISSCLEAQKELSLGRSKMPEATFSAEADPCGAREGICPGWAAAIHVEPSRARARPLLLQQTNTNLN